MLLLIAMRALETHEGEIMKIIQFHNKYLHVTDAADYAQNGLFRKLDETEESKFRTWARTQPDGVQINPLWHPVVQDELFITGKSTNEGGK